MSTPSPPPGALAEFAQRLNAARRDRETLGNLLCEFRPYLDFLVARIRGAPRGDDDSDNDMVQSTFVRALSAFDGFRGDTPAALRTWLRRILLRLYADNLRDRGRRPKGLPANYDAADLVSDSLARNIESEDTAEMHWALAQLPVEYQQVIRLRIVDSGSWDEISAQMDRSPDSARKLLARAMHQLRHVLRT